MHTQVITEKGKTHIIFRLPNLRSQIPDLRTQISALRENLKSICLYMYIMYIHMCVFTCICVHIHHVLMLRNWQRHSNAMLLRRQLTGAPAN